MERTQQKSKIVITRGHEQPPLVFGPERLHFLYSVTLPQVHLTLVSVLQGIAFGVLLLGIPIPKDTAWPDLLYYLLGQYFYLPFIISSLVIIFIWMQFVETSMFLFWPLSTVQAVLVFLLTLCEVVAFKEIASLPVWLAGLGTVALVGGFITRRNLQLNTKEIYESSAGAQQSFQSFFESNRDTGKLYIIIGAITIVLGLAFNLILGLVGSRFPQLAPFVSWVIIFSLSVCLIKIVQMDSGYRKRWLEHATEDTDLVATPHGVVTYKKIEVEISNEEQAPPSQQPGPHTS